MKTQELTIETLPIEIRVIRVGGHKMTLAVFDQLQLFPLNHLDFGPEGYDKPDDYPEEIIPKLQEFAADLKNEFTIHGWIRREQSGGPRYWLFVTWEGKPYKVFLGGPSYHWQAKHKFTSRPHNDAPHYFPQLFIAT